MYCSICACWAYFVDFSVMKYIFICHATFAKPIDRQFNLFVVLNCSHGHFCIGKKKIVLLNFWWLSRTFCFCCSLCVSRDVKTTPTYSILVTIDFIMPMWAHLKCKCIPLFLIESKCAYNTRDDSPKVK